MIRSLAFSFRLGLYVLGRRLIWSFQSTVGFLGILGQIFDLMIEFYLGHCGCLEVWGSVPLLNILPVRAECHCPVSLHRLYVEHYPDTYVEQRVWRLAG